MAQDPVDAERPIRSMDDMVAVFHAAETPFEEWRIGTEAEKFGVDAQSGAPMQYDGERGVVRVLEALATDHGWLPERESPDGPVVSLRRDHASVTLEPGAQLELSGAPQPHVHAICGEMRGHLHEIDDISRRMNLVWLSAGFHPLAVQDDLPWVPKLRYPIMREYLPTKGPRTLDMMRRTCTVQVNLDYENEEDAMLKLLTSLKLAPIFNAMLANSPFMEGRLAGKKSERGDVWRFMDPTRSGLIPPLWELKRPGYADYVEWALDAGMFLFKRDGKVITNTGQTFRSFWKDGYEGHHATLADWKLHLNTLFPEVRLKNTIEVRSCDALSRDVTCAVPALLTGLFYDRKAREAAAELAAPLDYEGVERARPELVRDGIAASVCGRPAREIAERLVELAAGGLRRRGRLSPNGHDERIHLNRLEQLVDGGRCPADLLTDGLDLTAPDLRRQILERTRV